MKRLRNVSLEISPKPMFDLSDEGILELFDRLFRQWHSLLKCSDEVSVLWWLSDGSDLLVYDGDMDRPIEWMAYLGYAHKTYDVPDKQDPIGESIVGHPRLYHPQPRVITCGDAKRIVGLIREAARRAMGRPVKVGYAFDPGAEFSNHPFRYRDHPELLIGDRLRCIDCTAQFAADERSFAGFPEGVPAGLPFGTFLGCQTQLYLDDLGFDYIWFSNSFGFGRSPYAFGGAGEFFDGETYMPEGNVAVHDAVLEFWRLFRRECPEYPVECRGTDFSAGINLVANATPYAGIYEEVPHLVPPPNTPWPALTQNHGIALAGYLSEISGFRGERFPFRYYTSDPWWCNSPWRDMWERRPHDIYLSASISRLNGDGGLDTVNDVKFLSVDTSWGELPDDIPDEVIPHIKRAVSYLPDAAPPVIWVYPFREYHQYTFEQSERMPEVMAGDLFIQQAYNCGLPMSGVITTAALEERLAADPAGLWASVLVTPVPDAGTDWEEALVRHLEAGGKVLCYGPTAHASTSWRERLNLRLAEPRSGQLPLVVLGDADCYANGRPALVCEHRETYSAGGIAEVLANPADGDTWPLAQAGDRVAALSRGGLAWVRGTSSLSDRGLMGRSLAVREPSKAYPCEQLMRQALATLGWELDIDRESPSKSATHLMIHRSENAFVMTGFAPERDVVYRLRTPLGAPLLPKRETMLVDGRACLPVWQWFHEECRIFIEQEDGELSLHSISPKHFRYQHRWALRGLRDATVRFFPKTGCFKHTQILLNPDFNHYVVSDEFEHEWVENGYGRHIEIRNVTGAMTFAWSPDELPEAIDPESVSWPDK